MALDEAPGAAPPAPMEITTTEVGYGVMSKYSGTSGSLSHS